MKRAADYGHGTRSRDKKHRSPDDGLQNRLWRIAQTGIVTEEDRLVLFRMSWPACHGCRVNSKDNPNCLCGLVPPLNGFRKTGLWQKVPQAVEALGENPAGRSRGASCEPIGLENLGATCYVNSVLQCLYMLPPFRSGVFAAVGEPELCRLSPVLQQLARVFTQLQAGAQASVDPLAFAATLMLDSSTQQDGQEFLKLLLSLLEGVLEKSQTVEARHLVQNLFCGTSSYVTRCSMCGRESDSSRNVVPFYEIELNVKGFAGLDESLDDYLSEERLEGENQYFCNPCGARNDATRAAKLRSLPPVVNFQLKRFVFNPKTTTKKKVTSRFSFPQSLDLGPRLSMSTDPEEDRMPGGGQARADGPIMYDLVAILVHKGSAATSGHYIAHVRDNKYQWWQFDDDVVKALGQHPLGAQPAANSQTNKSSKLEPFKRAGQDLSSSQAQDGSNAAEQGAGVEDMEVDRCQQQKVNNTSSRQNGGASGRGGASAPGDATPGSLLLTSADAYMLMYSRREEALLSSAPDQQDLPARQVSGCCSPSSEKPKKLHPSSTNSSSVGMAVAGAAPAGTGGGDAGPPPALLAEVEESNAKFGEECKQFAARMAEEIRRVAERREEVRRIVADAAVAPDVDANSGYWISSEWLRSWADGLEPPGKIDNTELQCEHGRVSLKKLPAMKRISPLSWAQLVSQYQGGPALTAGDCCDECIRKEARSAASAHSFRDKRDRVRALVNEMHQGGRASAAGPLYYVGKTWLSHWLRRTNVESASESDAGPTAALACPHGGLLPEQAPRAKRDIVSEEVWAYLAGVASAVAGPESAGCPAFREDHEECAICQVDMASRLSAQQGIRATMQELKQRHAALFSKKPLALSRHLAYQLVPSHWLSTWRRHVELGGSHPGGADLPEPLGEAVEAAKCKPHGGLLHELPSLVARRGEVVQRSPADDFFTVVQEADWLGLCQDWGGGPSEGISATLAPGPPAASASVSSWAPSAPPPPPTITTTPPAAAAAATAAAAAAPAAPGKAEECPPETKSRSEAVTGIVQDYNGGCLMGTRQGDHESGSEHGGGNRGTIGSGGSGSSSRGGNGGGSSSPARRSAVPGSERSDGVLTGGSLPSERGRGEDMEVGGARAGQGGEGGCGETAAGAAAGAGGVDLAAAAVPADGRAGAAANGPCAEEGDGGRGKSGRTRGGPDVGVTALAEDAAPQLTAEPPVCRACVAEKESAELARRLDYNKAEISVELAKGLEPPHSLITAAPAGVHGVHGGDGERRSVRARKATMTAGGRAKCRLTVSSATTLQALRMQIWESLNVVRENQRVGLGQQELLDDGARLADLGVLPGSRLWVVDTCQHPDRDIAEDLLASGGGGDDDDDGAEREEGFKGTGLLGGGSALASPAAPNETPGDRSGGSPSPSASHPQPQPQPLPGAVGAELAPIPNGRPPEPAAEAEAGEHCGSSHVASLSGATHAGGCTGAAPGPSVQPAPSSVPAPGPGTYPRASSGPVSEPDEEVQCEPGPGGPLEQQRRTVGEPHGRQGNGDSSRCHAEAGGSEQSRQLAAGEAGGGSQGAGRRLEWADRARRSERGGAARPDRPQS